MGVEFTYAPLISDYGRWPVVPEAIKEEISKRTPAFRAIQLRWWTHCEEAGEYLEQADGSRLLEYGDSVIDKLLEEEGVTRDEVFDCLLGGVFHAQLFSCPTCGQIGGYIDAS